MSAASAERLPLAPVLDLRAAKPLAETLSGRRGTPIELDASPVDRLGAQCLQVLLSARRSWAADGCAFQLVDPSDGFVSQLRIFGLSTADLNHEPGEP